MSTIEVSGLVLHRGGKRVLHGIDLTIAAGEITALVGANGAGKSSLVGAMSGVLPLTTGKVLIDGERVDGKSADAVRRAGIAIVPEGHRVLTSLTVIDNLRAAGSMLQPSALADAIEEVLALFPELLQRLEVRGGSLSGGQKQMVAMGQALIARPRFLLIDELSLGLAPAIVKRLAGTLTGIAAKGTGVLLIEQFTSLALSISRKAMVMERGNLVFSGTAADLSADPEILHSAYLAGGKGQ